jgi:transposase
MVNSPGAMTMPRPIPVPIRQAVFRLWQEGRQTHEIAALLELPRSTVRRLLGRVRRSGAEGLVPSYHRPTNAPAEPPGAVQAALRLRREHPTWGGGMIRLQLLQGMPAEVVPSARALQRWFVKYDLTPAPRGRRPRGDTARSALPHETWQMDAKEHIHIRSGIEVSWLRIVDECSGAVLWTAVFPPGDLQSGPCRGRAGANPPGAGTVGHAGAAPSR